MSTINRVNISIHPYYENAFFKCEYLLRSQTEEKKNTCKILKESPYQNFSQLSSILERQLAIRPKPNSIVIININKKASSSSQQVSLSNFENNILAGYLAMQFSPVAININ